MRETHSTRQSQSRTNLISQQPGEDEIAQSQPAAAHRWDNLVETFYGVSLEEKCICLSWKQKNGLVDLENRGIHETYEQKFSLFLKPLLQRDKKFHPPLPRHNAKLPGNWSFMVDRHGDGCKHNHKSHYPAKYWVWIKKRKKKQASKRAAFQVKRDNIWNCEWRDLSQVNCRGWDFV